MAFRHCKFKSVVPCGNKILEPVRVNTACDDGSISSVVAFQSVDVSSSRIPNREDYTLEKLVNANIPLQQVNPTILTSDEDTIKQFVDNNLKIEDNEN